MRPLSSLLAISLAGLIALLLVGESWAADYDSRFVRNYPPGYYGMWYNAERFYEIREPGKPPEELYRWDKYMSQVTGVIYPFFPVPFAWDYGTGRTFNLPDYHTNDWR
jgi:hypothetical protein